MWKSKQLALQILLATLLLFVNSCSEVSLVGFGKNGEEQREISIIQKNYTRPPLSRTELDQLIEMTVFTGSPDHYGDITLDEQVEQYGSTPVAFSHRTHRSRYTCSVCHIELEFSLKQGETGITREDILDGRYCGACHNGKLAFSTEFACDACHLELDPNAPRYPARAFATENLQLPSVKYGDRINWVEALQQGSVEPQRSLYGNTQYPSMPLPDHLLKPLLWTTATPNLLVRFPHVEHVEWLDCSNCHPDLFSIKQTGTVEFNKESNLYGQFCGTCHMNVALPMNGCSRCHPRLKDHS